MQSIRKLLLTSLFIAAATGLAAGPTMADTKPADKTAQPAGLKAFEDLAVRHEAKTTGAKPVSTTTAKPGLKAFEDLAQAHEAKVVPGKTVAGTGAKPPASR